MTKRQKVGSIIQNIIYLTSETRELDSDKSLMESFNIYDQEAPGEMFEIVEASKIVNLINETATARKTCEIAAIQTRRRSRVVTMKNNAKKYLWNFLLIPPHNQIQGHH